MEDTKRMYGVFKEGFRKVQVVGIMVSGVWISENVRGV
jgi:hypothetical protein